MSSGDWHDNTMENRREVVRKSIRRASIEELKELGLIHFPVVSDPWFERYHNFLKDNAASQFYRAGSPEGAEIVYCRDSGQGVWFLPGVGMGIIQPKGLQMLAEVVDGV